MIEACNTVNITMATKMLKPSKWHRMTA